MTTQEAIEILWQYDVNFEPHPAEEIMHAIDLAIEALKLEQRILDNGYTGKEAEFRIGGRLFGIKEKAQ